MLTAFSYDSVSTWVNDNFATSFEQLPRLRDLTFHKYNAPQHSKSGPVEAIVLGTITNRGRTLDLVAWLGGSRMHFGYPVEQKDNTLQLCSKMFGDKTIQFNEPFLWSTIGRFKRGKAQLKALVRYYFLAKGHETAVRDNLLDFECHFPDACAIVASEIEKKTQNDILKERAIERKIQNDRLREKALKRREAQKKDTSTSTSTPNGLYDFEIYVQSVVNGRAITIFSSPSPSPPPASNIPDHTSSAKTIKLEHCENEAVNSQEQEHNDTRTTLMNEYNAVQERCEKERREAQNVLEDVKMRLAVVERKARKAEEDAAFWEGKYKEVMGMLKERDA